MIGALTVPVGWEITVLGPHSRALMRPLALGGGFVSIDFAARVFAPGCGQPQRYAVVSTAAYRGRGWQAQLVADAVAWLESVTGG